VIKDGLTRDQLSADLGGILCFEMEAAGLMSNFLCIDLRNLWLCRLSQEQGVATMLLRELLNNIPGMAVAFTGEIHEPEAPKSEASDM
jgi:hypothetical protein